MCSSNGLEEQLENALGDPGDENLLRDLLPKIRSSAKVFGYSIVYWAAKNKWWKMVVNDLANAGCFPSDSEVDEETGDTVLHVACVNDANAKTVKYLTETCNLHPLKKNKFGETAYDVCSTDHEAKDLLKQIIDEAHQKYQDPSISEFDKISNYLMAKKKENIEETADAVKKDHTSNVSLCNVRIYGLPESSKSSIKRLLMGLKKPDENIPQRALSVVNFCGDVKTSEALNLLYRNPSHFVVTIRLSDNYDATFVEFNLSLIAQVCEMAKDIAARTHFEPRVFIVGTYVGTDYNNKKRNDLGKKLSDSLESYQHILVRTLSSSLIHPVAVNASTTDLQEQILSATNHSLSDHQQPNHLPRKWIVFYRKLVDVGVATFSKCCEIGKRLGMEDQVQAALHELDALSMVIHDDDLIIADTDIFNKKLTCIAKACASPLSEEMPNEHAIAKTKGIVNYKVLKKSFGLAEEELPNERFVKLLVKFNMAVPTEGSEVFLPFALFSLEPQPHADEKLFTTSLTPSFMVTWDAHSLPPGFFLNLTAELCNKSKKNALKLCLDGSQGSERIHLKPENSSMPGTIKLIKKRSSLVISFQGDWFCNDNWSNGLKIFSTIDDALQNNFSKFRHIGLSTPTLRMTCPISHSHTSDHCSCYVFQMPEQELDSSVVMCSENTKQIVENNLIKDFQGPWNFLKGLLRRKSFVTIHPEKDNSIDDSELYPDTKTLVQVYETVHEINDWHDLGLLLDLKISELDRIKRDNRGEVSECREKMMKAWLDNGSASWKKLASALMQKRMINHRQVGIEIFKKQIKIPSEF